MPASYTPSLWWQLSEQARAAASRVKDPDRQIQLLLIAERYRVLAKRADAARVKDSEDPDPD
jgi:hypothetical protein